MAETDDVYTAVVPGPGDALRIVPLYRPEEAVAPVAPLGPTPKLTYRGGPLLRSVEVFTVFWGTGWKSAAAAAIIPRVNAFFDAVVTSALIDQLSEYDVPGMSIGHGRHIGTATVTSPTPRSVVTDSAVQHLVQQEISTNPAFPRPGPNTLYFVYLAPGVAVVQGGHRSCQSFCGYHNAIGSQVFYAVMPYPGCSGCTGQLAATDALIATSSHELAEAVTDPVPGSGWYDDSYGEIGDMCAWKFKRLGTYTVQLLWSNVAGACI